MKMEVEKTITLILNQDEARLVAGLLLNHCLHDDCPFAEHPSCCGTDHPVCYETGEALNKALEE